MKRVCVFCASTVTNNPIYESSARDVSQYFAKKRIGIVYGGSSSGMMGELAKSAIANRGEIIGVLPHFISHKDPAHPGLTQLFMVDSMHERKMKMFELSDGIIALPGGFGTLEQFFEMITWAQLGLHSKPIGILNVNGYYDGFLSMIEVMQKEGTLKGPDANLVICSKTIDVLFAKMKDYKPIVNSLKMRESQT